MPIRNPIGHLATIDDGETLLIEDRLRALLTGDADLAGTYFGPILDFPLHAIAESEGLLVSIFTNREYLPAQTLSTRRLDPEIVLEVAGYLDEGATRTRMSETRRRVVRLTTLLRKVIWRRYRVDPSADSLWYRMSFGTPVTTPFFGENNSYFLTRTVFSLSANQGA
ncbi:MAG: hypothetical protein SFU56_09215 [Capsulimonadales bacterium]|nr:hypothetical protein [Capsulimonadales bacterium]